MVALHHLGCLRPNLRTDGMGGAFRHSVQPRPSSAGLAFVAIMARFAGDRAGLDVGFPDVNLAPAAEVVGVFVLEMFSNARSLKDCILHEASSGTCRAFGRLKTRLAGKRD